MNDSTSSSSPSIRWWPAAVIVALTLVGLAYIWGRDVPARQPQVLATILTLVGAGALLFLWATLFSRLAGRVRLGIFAGTIIAGLLFLTLFRIEGVSGDLLPILSFKFAGERNFAESIDPARAGDIAVSPTDSPQYRGPNRTGVIDSVRLARDWQTASPTELWRNPVGDAWSGFSVVGEAAVTQEQRGEQELVVRYELTTGQTVWTHSDEARYSTAIGGTGPRATPTIADGRVYTMGATGVVNALDLADGALIWTRNVVEEYGASVPEWGKSNSPLVHGDMLVVAVGAGGGSSLAAFDLATGEPRWTAGSGMSSYASPDYAVLGGRPMLLNLNHLTFDAHDPADGTLLWSLPWEATTPSAAQPLVLDDERVLISAGYGVGSRAYRVGGGSEPEQLYESNRLKAKFASMVLHEGTIYGLDDGIFVAIDPETGERRWKRGRYGHGQLLLIGDLILIQAEKGDVVLIEANPEKLVELGRIKALSDKTWNPLTLSGKYLLVRNHREAVCFELPLES